MDWIDSNAMNGISKSDFHFMLINNIRMKWNRDEILYEMEEPAFIITVVYRLGTTG